jgi:hypothetical protein
MEGSEFRVTSHTHTHTNTVFAIIVSFTLSSTFVVVPCVVNFVHNVILLTVLQNVSLCLSRMTVDLCTRFYHSCTHCVNRTYY